MSVIATSCKMFHSHLSSSSSVSLSCRYTCLASKARGLQATGSACWLLGNRDVAAAPAPDSHLVSSISRTLAMLSSASSDQELRRSLPRSVRSMQKSLDYSLMVFAKHLLPRDATMYRELHCFDLVKPEMHPCRRAGMLNNSDVLFEIDRKVASFNGIVIRRNYHVGLYRSSMLCTAINIP